MQPRLSRLSVVLAMFISSAALADDSSGSGMVGSYLLSLDDKFQRVLTLGEGGVAQEISQDESVVGYTAGQGTWKAVASDAASVKLINFAFNAENGKPIGPTVTVYELRFADKQDDGFQRVSGQLEGAQHATGQNVLKKSAQPLRTFRARFSGQRVAAD